MVKKTLHFLCLLALMAIPSAVFGQTIQIGTGTSGTYSVPINIRYDYSYGQMIYAKDDIAAGNPMTNIITGIEFDHVGNVNQSFEITVYMKNVSYETFSTTTFEPVTDADIVYQGSVTPANGWTALELTNQFSYDPDQHLLVAINKTGGGKVDSNYTWHHITKTNAVLYNSSQIEQDRTEPYDPAIDLTGNQNQKLPNIRITFYQRPIPTAPVATLTQGDGTVATLSWTENGLANNWVLQYGTDEAFADGTYTEVTSGFDASASPIISCDIAGLTPESRYFARVKAYYSDTDQSNWSNNGVFTPTDSNILTLYDATGTSSYVPFFRQVNSYSDIASQFIFPTEDIIDIQNGSINKLTFYSTHNTVNYGTAEFQVYIGEVSNTTLSSFVDWESLTNVYTGPVNVNYGMLEITFTTPYTYIGGDLLIGFKQTNIGEANITEQVKWHGDESKPKGSSRYLYNNKYTSLGYLPKTTINYVESTGCNKPVDLVVTKNTNTATLTWLSNADQWQVAHNTESVDPDGHIVAEVNDMTYTMENLSLGDHYFWVRSHCDGDEYSEWCGPALINIGYCVPAPSNVDGDGITNVTFGSGDYTVNNDTPKSVYTDYSNLVGSIQAGVPSNIAITYSTGYDYGTIIWVDFNDNIEFEDDEIVYVGKSTKQKPTTLNAYITIPVDTPLGNYHIRIGGADSAFDSYISYYEGTTTTPVNPPSACYSGNWACFQDYTINVLEAPSCLPSSEITATVDFTTVTLTWVSDASEWDVAHSTSPTADPTENMVAMELTTNTYQMENLEIANHYFWVRSHCSMDNHSPWAGPVMAHVGYCIPNPSGVDNNGISNISFGTGDYMVNNDTPKSIYTDYSNLVGGMRAGLTSPIDITYATSYTYGTIIWVDWNNNLEFEDSEIVYVGMSTNQNPTTLHAAIHIPATQALGDYYMRIGGADSGFDAYVKYILGESSTPADAPSACYSGNWACFQDYKLRVLEAPGCLPPSELAATEDQPNQSELSWASYSGETLWTVYYKKATDNEYTEVAVSENPYTLENLEAATTYQYYVVANCSTEEESDPSDVFSFTTSCPEYLGVPYFENFDSYNIVSSSSPSERVLPHCWDYINGSTYLSNMYYPTISSYSYSGDYSYSSPNYLEFSIVTYSDNDYDPKDQYVILPAVQNISSKRIKLYARANTINSYYDATFKVGVMEGNTFVQVGNSINPTSTTYQQYVIPFSSYNGTGTNIAIMVEVPETPTTSYTNAYRSVLIDNITVEDIPNCIEPTDLALVESSQHTITIQWTAGGDEESWKLQYKKLTETDWTSIDTPVTTPHTIEGLDAATTYNVRVAAWCDTTDPEGISQYCDPITASTECDQITSLPWTVNFEGYPINTLPLCWDNSASTSSTVNTTTSYYIWGIHSYDGNKMIRMYNYWVQTGTAIINTPEIVLPSEQVYQLEFDYSNRANCGPLKLNISTDNGATFTELQSYESTNGSSQDNPGEFQEAVVSLAAYAGQTVILQFYAYANYGSGAIFVDNVNISLPPTCAKPIGLACDVMTAHTAYLSWTNGDAGQDTWQIAYSTDANFNPNDIANPVEVHENPATIGNLEANTTYYAYVRANCGDTDGVSAWCNNKATFTTTIGNAMPTNITVNQASITSSEATVNWYGVTTNDLHESYELYYSRFNILPEPLEADSLFVLSAPSYSFENLEEETTYYVWVRDNCGEDGYSAWTSSIYFTTSSSCQTPDGLTESNVTAHSAQISWNTYGNTTFNLRYGTDGTNWTVVENIACPYSLTNVLQSNTTYQVQVQATCNTEVWSTAISFITNCDAYTITTDEKYTQDFENPIVTSLYNSTTGLAISECWEKYSDNSSACAVPHLLKAGATYNYASLGQVLYFYGAGSGYAALPEFTNPISDLQISFKYAVENSSYGTLTLGYITSEDVNYNTFTTIKEYPASATYNQTLAPIVEYLNEVPATAARLVFRWEYNSQWGANIDDLEVALIPSCYPVGTLSYDDTSIATNSAVLSWTLVDNTQEAWQIQYATNESFTEGVNSVDVTTHENYTLEELDPDTHYYVHVRANCGSSDGYSEWSNIVDFTTLPTCPAPTQITASSITQISANITWQAENDSYNIQYGYDDPEIAYIYDFEDNTIPSTWVNDSQYPWAVVVEEGKHFMRSTNQGIAISESIIEAVVELERDGFISFYAKCMGEGTSIIYDACKFYIDGVEKINKGENGDQWDKYSFELTEGEHTLTWSYTKDSSVDKNGDAFSVDNIIIGYHEMQWDYVEDITTTSYNLNNLFAGTEYTVMLQSECNGTDGNWSDAIQFTTLEEGKKVFVAEGNWGTPGNWVPAGVPALDEDVVLRANVTIESGCVAKANKISLEGTPTPTITIEDGGQLFANSLLNAQVKKTITEYGDGNAETNLGYHLIAVPTAMNQDPANVGLITDDLGNTATIENSTYDLYGWNGSATAQWLNYRNSTFSLSNAKGYLYASRNGVDITFSGALLNNSNDKVVNLTYDTETAAGTWNLIGNPFVCNANIGINEGTVNYYKIGTGDNDGLLVPASGAVAPMEGIFVQATAENQSATFTRALPDANNGNKDGILQIALNRNNSNNRGMSRVDNARVRFGEGNELKKFQLNANSTKVYIPQNGTDYAVVYSKGNGTVPVNVKITKTGSYTISISNEDVTFNYLHLIDKFTGADVDLLIDDSYTFTASAIDEESRFLLVFEAADNNYDPTSDIFAYQNDSEIIVNGDGTLQVYDVMGRFVASYEIHGNKRINAETFSNAVYIFRLVGTDVKTQKIVIR